MPSHQERVKRNYSKCFESGHNFITIMDSAKAPTIEKNGDRTTTLRCMECGEYKYYTRSQSQFESELNEYFDNMNPMNFIINKSPSHHN